MRVRFQLGSGNPTQQPDLEPNPTTQTRTQQPNSTCELLCTTSGPEIESTGEHLTHALRPRCSSSARVYCRRLKVVPRPTIGTADEHSVEQRPSTSYGSALSSVLA